MRFNVYVDALNLYYSLIRKRNPDKKWLDIRATVEGLLPTPHEVNRVRYFTARVSGKAGSPTAPDRQDRYLRALESHGGVDIHQGHFVVGEENFYRTDGLGKVEVWNIVEKCSDVNMATHILLDVIAKDCDAVAIITNDADPRVLITALQNPPFKMPVWVFSPSRDKNKRLRPTEYRTLRASDLVLLPRVVRTSSGRELHCPADWR
jgi:NYN domain-containing protein